MFSISCPAKRHNGSAVSLREQSTNGWIFVYKKNKLKRNTRKVTESALFYLRFDEPCGIIIRLLNSIKIWRCDYGPKENCIINRLLL